jgi:SulP family sulfate permease
MKQASDLAETETTVTSLDPEPVWDDEAQANVEKNRNVFIKHLYGPLFFGFSSGFRALVDSLPKEAETLVVRMERVPYIDQSGLYTLEDTILRLTQEGKTIALTGLQTQPADMLRRIGLVPNLIAEDLVFDTFEDCQQWIDDGGKVKEASLED